MIPLSVDETRIVEFMEKLVKKYDEAAALKPFSFHRVRAAVLRRVIAAVREGDHR